MMLPEQNGLEPAPFKKGIKQLVQILGLYFLHFPVFAMHLPCPFCSDFPLRPCDRFEFIGLAGHFTGDWAQTPAHSSRQLPMYTNVIFCCTGWLIGTGPSQWVITIIYNPHIGMQLSMAMMPLNKHVMWFMWRVSQRNLPAATRVQTKTKNKKQTWSFTTLGRNVFNCFANWKTPNLQSDS